MNAGLHVHQEHKSDLPGMLSLKLNHNQNNFKTLEITG